MDTTVGNDPPAHASSTFPIAIIGSGFGGLGAAIQLRNAGFDDFTIFERADEIGGTWRDNTYPGAACDVPSHVYSFSFEQNPDWSRTYSSSQEIQAYLLRLVDKHDLRRHIRFHSAIASARFDESAGSWTLTTARGETFVARAVICAVGGLVDPAWPEIPGLATFRGEMFHTARWKHDASLAGKRVGVIGTGASAIQVIPAIAPEVAHLRVFQRTPAWVVPRRDMAMSETAKERFRRHPLLLRAFRAALYLRSEILGPMIMLDSPRLSRGPEKMSLRHLERSVRDPELRRRLTPHFQFGCKRMLVSDDYWSTFERDNVELVTDAIEEIRPDGILTKDGRLHELDVLVLATGFEVGLARPPFDVRGLGGLALEHAWRAGAMAYKGISVAGFPNWFILMGPNTGPGHTSVLIYTEAQIRFVLQAIRRLKDGGLRWLSVKQAVQDSYNRRLQRRMKHTVWASGCKSWYLDASGENHALFPGLAAEYNLRARHFDPADFETATA